MAKQKLRIGILGAGGMGRSHAKSIETHPDALITAVCDNNKQSAEETADCFNIGHVFTDEKAMFASDEIDAVVIATPNVFHAPQTIAALKMGLHVLCEKPMATTVRDAKRMLKAAGEARRTLMINFSYRFSPMSFALKQQVDAGVVGDIYFGRTVWHRRRGLPGFGGWFGQKELSGGGPLIDLGVHRLDLALWLMGYPDPVSVTGATYNPIASELAKREKKKFDVEDCAGGLIRFANGATLILEASWALNIKEQEHMVTSLYGTCGGLVQRNQNQGYEFTAELYTEENGALFTKTLDGATIPVPSSQHEFINSILEKRAPLATAEQGIKVMKILEGIYKSSETGREVRYKRP